MKKKSCENHTPYLSIFHHKNGESYQILNHCDNGVEFWKNTDGHEPLNSEEWIDSWELPPLYAAAPELLDFVKAALPMFIGHSYNGKPMIEAAHALIAKAEARS